MEFNTVVKVDNIVLIFMKIYPTIQEQKTM